MRECLMPKNTEGSAFRPGGNCPTASGAALTSDIARCGNPTGDRHTTPPTPSPTDAPDAVAIDVPHLEADDAARGRLRALESRAIICRLIAW
jgi:hypothetical protein